ncbi:MAG: nucleotidyltransferase domain-containing protein [Actinomycetota bacterium]
MSETYDRALSTAVEQLKDEFGEKLLGLLVAGSYAYGEPMATSDIDMFVVVDEHWRQRRNLVIDGVEVELFINPPHRLSAEIMKGESATDMFARGRAIYDPRGAVGRLVAEAKALNDQPRPIPLGDDLWNLRYRVTDTTKDAFDLLEAEDDGFEFALNHALHWTLEAYYQLAGRRMPKAKYVDSDLREREPALGEVVRSILDTSNPRRERWERLHAVDEEILAHVGGPIVTDATSRIPDAPVPVVTHIEGVELPDEDIVVPPPTKRASVLVLVASAIGGLGLFVVALGLMRSGAAELAPVLSGSIFTDNAWSTLGLGWLGACIVLSGSPVAASALALFDGGSIDRTQAFTMLAGSRLGASFVVLVAGTVYALRHRTGSGRRAPISIGVLALLVTMVIYLPSAAIGYALLDNGVFDGLSIGTSPSVTSATDAAFGWVVDAARAVLPGWSLFPIGVLVLLAGFWLIDKVMPSVGAERAEDHPRQWYERKWAMFGLGCGVCLLTLSVSVALTVLVPLVAKGYLRRANTIPYIAGANITTLADTLVAAILLGNIDAVRVVFSATSSVLVITLLVLAFAYRPVRRLCLIGAQRILASPRRLAAFVVVLFAVPLVLIAV